MALLCAVFIIQIVEYWYSSVAKSSSLHKHCSTTLLWCSRHICPQFWES